MDPVGESERLVTQLREFTVREVGGSSYLRQHQTLSHLNGLSHASARGNSEDFVLATFLTQDRLSLIVHELLVVECWRENVYPRLFAPLSGRGGGDQCGLRAYFCLHHEEVLVNLLEVFLFHDYAAEALGDALVDLIDYCVRRVTHLISLTHQRGRRAGSGGSAAAASGGLATDPFTVLPGDVWPTPPTSSSSSSLTPPPLDTPSQLARWRGASVLRVGVTCVSLLRYLSDHARKLPLAAAARLLDVHDVPLLCVPLIENPPWVKREERGEGGGWVKYNAHAWVPCPPSDLLVLTPCEGQPWLTLHALLMEAEVRARYPLTPHRRATLLRVRKFLNGVLVDQLPILEDIQRLLDEITIAPPGDAGGGEVGGKMLMQAVPEMSERVVKEALRAPVGWVREAGGGGGGGSSSSSCYASSSRSSSSGTFLGGEGGESTSTSNSASTTSMLKLAPTHKELQERGRVEWSWDEAAEHSVNGKGGAFRARRKRGRGGEAGRQHAQSLHSSPSGYTDTWPDSEEDEDLMRLGSAFAGMGEEGGPALGEPICAKCGEVATKRCARCKNEWYCCREHQLECWEGHKTVCDIVANDGNGR